MVILCIILILYTVVVYKAVYLNECQRLNAAWESERMLLYNISNYNKMRNDSSNGKSFIESIKRISIHNVSLSVRRG